MSEMLHSIKCEEHRVSSLVSGGNTHKYQDLVFKSEELFQSFLDEEMDAYAENMLFAISDAHDAAIGW